MATELIPTPRPPQALIAVAQQREIAEVQSKMIIARANPRDEKEATDRIVRACTRQSLAESALYSYNRGGTEISGPSIRLAEVLAQNWGNMDFGVRELEQRDGESTVEAYAWDLESNVSQRKVFQVAHIRYSRNKGNTTLTDPRDIYEMIANQGARRLRSCILGVIPGDVVEIAQKQCELTLATKIQITPDLIKSLVAKFAEFNVTKEMLEKRIQRHLDAINPAQVVQLGKIYNSMKDGMSVAAEWFGADRPAAEKGVLNIADLSPSKAENRGHGNEGLDQVAKPPAAQPDPEPPPPDDEQEFTNTPPPPDELFDHPPTTAPNNNGRRITEKQVGRLYAICRKRGMNDTQIKAELKRMGIEDSTLIRMDQYEDVCSFFEQWTA